MRNITCLAVPGIMLTVLLLSVGSAAVGDPNVREKNVNPYTQWKNGPPKGADYFPIAVWLQDPKYAKQYKAAGINVYIGLWKGPTDKQLADLKAAGMSVICAQNQVGLKHIDDPTIIGWMHGDEPDNAQTIGRTWKTAEEIQEAWPDLPKRTLAKWGKYGPPIPPKTIIANYKKIKAADPSRPVILNLGQGVAYDTYRGRGTRSGKLEDYPQYIKGCDLVSFDIYPVVHSKPAVKGNLWYVARGVERLVQWSGDRKVVWNCIECTHISQPPAKANPHQIRAEVWMSIVHGSTGLIYFVHQFKPKFDGHALLNDPVNLAAVTALNKQIRELAPVINSPTIEGQTLVASSNKDVPIAIMDKRHAGARYVFAVAMRDGDTTGAFTLKGSLGEGPGASKVEVIGEDRTIEIKGGAFTETFKGYDVHLYRIPLPKK